VRDIHLINWTIQEAQDLKAGRREPDDLDALPSLDRLLAGPEREPPELTNPDDSVTETALQTTTEPAVVVSQPEKADEPPKSTVNKITWPHVGRVTEPGRYMLRFGWLTISADDIAVWEQFPTAAFTLIRTRTAEAGKELAEEYHLGTFEFAGNNLAW
jgi:hypothetical protein